VVAALERAASDEEPQVRLEAAFALWKNTSTPQPRFVQSILDRLQDEKVFWRRKAARYLAEMRPDSHEAIPALNRALKDPDSETRILAVRAIVQIDPGQADAVVPILRDALLDRGPRRRTSTAAQILGDLGPRARDAVPALAEATEDSFAPAASAAADALEKVEPGLLAKLKTDPAARRKLILPELIRALGGSLEVRGFAFQSLKRFGKDAQEAVPYMIAALNNPELKHSRYDWVWLRALDALGAIGPPATNAAPLLLEALHHHTVAIRSGAASAISRIGICTPEAISALVKTLQDDEPVVRAYAARALGDFGPPAKEALPALESALRSEELQLHALAMAEAIKKIAPQRLQDIERDQRALQTQK
jgi:HEAT repeat protein